MLKTATLAAALIVAASPLALAQTSTQPRTAPTSPSTAPSATTTPSTGTAGSSMMPEADLKRQLEQQGYSQIQLRDDTSSSDKGDWAGSAMKNGKQVNIHVDPSGKVSER